MASAEDRLRKLGLMKSSPNHPAKVAKRGNKKTRAEPQFLYDGSKANNQFLGGYVEDDHVPFMARGVEILHIIPSPFPRVWHEMTDDGDHLDMDTVEDWAKIVLAFTAEWMELEGFFDFKAEKRKEHAEKSEL
jgi:glutaminyl-peptide cyclotransferase